MNEQKEALLKELKPWVEKAIDAIRKLERCVVDAQNGELKTATAIEAARALIDLQQNLESIISKNNGTTESIIQFVTGDLKQTILNIGEALKLAVKTGQTDALIQHTQSFRVCPRSLFNLIKESMTPNEASVDASSSSNSLNNNQNAVVVNTHSNGNMKLQNTNVSPVSKSDSKKRPVRSKSLSQINVDEDVIDTEQLREFSKRASQKLDLNVEEPVNTGPQLEEVGYVEVNGGSTTTTNSSTTEVSKGRQEIDGSTKLKVVAPKAEKRKSKSSSRSKGKTSSSSSSSNKKKSSSSSSKSTHTHSDSNSVSVSTSTSVSASGSSSSKKSGSNDGGSSSSSKSKSSSTSSSSSSKHKKVPSSSSSSSKDPKDSRDEKKSSSKSKEKDKENSVSTPSSSNMKKSKGTDKSSVDSKKASQEDDGFGELKMEKVEAIKKKRSRKDPAVVERRRSMPIPRKPKEFDEKEKVKNALIDIGSFIGFDTDPGKRYGKTNQDAYLVCTTGKSGYIFAVFDGHGVNGEIAAQIAKKTFADFFLENDLFQVDSQTQVDMITTVFRLAHENIIAKYETLTEIKWEGEKFRLVNIKNLMMYQNKKDSVLLQDFGTTAVMAAVKTLPTQAGAKHAQRGASEIIFANAGDSIAYIGREDRTLSIKPVDQLVTIHNGDDPQEEERVSKEGSCRTDGHYVSPPEDSGFGWAQLAVTRSLGHKYFSRYGIIPDPDILFYSPHVDDKYLVVTSDGVTDVFSPHEIFDSVVNFQEETHNIQKTTTKLVKHSVSMWRKRFTDANGRGEAADNTSAILVDLKKIYWTGEQFVK
eukprot:TRINITY_DN166_c1_g2_i1.p1 TRINITY_DN166_c1_g2~~TRINITY_DN166_c1_g2_i1.p1  ORF type:complete len:811 (-),score=260.86 TRINITY_DN166_c1_g2_i1:229-2661(-)